MIKQNYFQKELAAKQKAMAKNRADRLKFSNAIAKLTKITALQANKANMVIGLGVYEIYGQTLWTGRNKCSCFWFARHKGEIIKCGPTGCTVPKPVDKAEVLKEIKAKLK